MSHRREYSVRSLLADVQYVTAQIFSSGRNWSEPLEKAKKLVHGRGGPAVMLARSPKVSVSRLFLEIAAIYELFGNDLVHCISNTRAHLGIETSGCLVNADTPTLLAPNVSNWWYVSRASTVMCIVLTTTGWSERVRQTPSPMSKKGLDCPGNSSRSWQGYVSR